MTVTQNGFKKDISGSWISKDPAAVLVYTLDWTEWLPTGTTITNSSVTVSTIAADAAPLTKVSNGVSEGNKSYVELSGGTKGNLYTITTTVTTSDGEIDRRRFRVKVEERYA
jgi:hypothetical protein